MKQERLQEQIIPKTWEWPVDLTTYERTPGLRSSERAELERFIPHGEPRYVRDVRWFGESSPALERLLRPLQDALNVTRADKRVRRDTICTFLLEMDSRASAFWAWTHDEWVEILGNSVSSFQERHRTRNACRQHVLAVGYLLHCFSDFSALGPFNLPKLAEKVFGRELLEGAHQRTQEELLRWGYGISQARDHTPHVLCAAFLKVGSPYLEDLTYEALQAIREEPLPGYSRAGTLRISRVLVHMGILDKPLPLGVRVDQYHFGNHDALADLPPTWVSWFERWLNTSTLRQRKNVYYELLQMGRWLKQQHPEVTSPAQWTRELAAEYVAAIDRLTIGQWAKANRLFPEKIGQPMSARSKRAILSAVRTFFRDCQEWNWIPVSFDPRRCLATPRSIQALIAPDPRVIADDIWAKLLWAGLNLTNDDLPGSVYQPGAGRTRRDPWYPLEMVRAMVVTWLFAGLRSDEFRRLRVGCIRWQREDVRVPGADEMLSKDAICWLDVPAHKTGTAFTKAVDKVVGEAIVAWEQLRPSQPPAVDPKTGEVVHYLFSHRSTQIGTTYLNASLIPILCKKAGIPESDARGDITSHRARSTIASQLYNAKEPLSLFDLQEWWGIGFFHQRNTTPRSRRRKWQKPTKRRATLSGTCERLKCSLTKMRSRAERPLRGHRGASMTSGMATASTSSLTSAPIAWPVRSARFTCRKSRVRRSSWRAKRICCAYSKRSRSARKSAQQSKMGSRRWRNCMGSF
jgi:Phage integrase family